MTLLDPARVLKPGVCQQGRPLLVKIPIEEGYNVFAPDSQATGCGRGLGHQGSKRASHLSTMVRSSSE